MSSPDEQSKDAGGKKASFYVLFLGAKECMALRGEDNIRPAVHTLLDKNREDPDAEPTKVTLHINNKGIKVVQTMLRKNSKCRLEDVKHFIPSQAITFVMQESRPNDDTVGCVVFMYNPATRCPLHVHVFRCDGTETACCLRRYIAALIDKPDQQRRVIELEARLQAKGLLPTNIGSNNSDGHSSKESESGEESERNGAVIVDDRVKRLYDSLAAELREKLNGKSVVGSGPILLPPRDYDTVHRQKGKLEGIELRRSLTASVVGPNAVSLTTPSTNNSKLAGTSELVEEHSGDQSSGFGSDEAPGSPQQDRSREVKQVSSEEEPEEDWRIPTSAFGLRKKSVADKEISTRERSKSGPTEPLIIPAARSSQRSLDKPVSLSKPDVRNPSHLSSDYRREYGGKNAPPANDIRQRVSSPPVTSSNTLIREPSSLEETRAKLELVLDSTPSSARKISSSNSPQFSTRNPQLVSNKISTNNRKDFNNLLTDERKPTAPAQRTAIQQSGLLNRSRFSQDGKLEPSRREVERCSNRSKESQRLLTAKMESWDDGFNKTRERSREEGPGIDTLVRSRAVVGRSAEDRRASREEFDNNINKYAERWREEEKKKFRLFPDEDYLEPIRRDPRSKLPEIPNRSLHRQRSTSPNNGKLRTPSNSPPPPPERHSSTRPTRYTELPAEKRYPGLDRATARLDVLPTAMAPFRSSAYSREIPIPSQERERTGSNINGNVFRGTNTNSLKRNQRGQQNGRPVTNESGHERYNMTVDPDYRGALNARGRHSLVLH